VPAYQYVQPHLLDGYRATSAFTSSTVVPAFVWTWNKTYTFLDGTVGPQIRAVYVENVEPQLVKIGKRLGRYSTGKKSVPKPPPDSSTASTKTTSSFTKPAASVSATSTSADPKHTEVKERTESKEHAETKERTDSRPRSTMEPVLPPEIDENLEKEDPRRETREIVAADLKDWQERYAKAADEAAAEIDERVQEIAKKMIRRNARITGKALLEQLQSTAVSELVTLRRAIVEIVGTVNKGSATPEEGQEQIVKVVRRAGMAVKERGQAVRSWREQYETETQAAVTQAAETHFAILENIRDLALQKIGMKWAWTDGITYKDWAKYHLLKSRFDEWKGDLQNHVTSHPSLEAAQIEAANIEDEAMGVAASTAKELARMKQVAAWKLAAGDDTPEFDSTLMQQAAEAVEAAKAAAASAAEAVGDSVKEAAGGVSEGVAEGVSSASEAVSKATEAVLGSEEASEQATSQGQETHEKQTPVSDSTTASETSDPSSEPAVEASLALEDSETSPTEAAHAEAPEPEVEAEAEAVASEELSSVVEPTSEPTPADQPDVASSMLFETPVMAGNFTEPVDEDKAGPVELSVEDSETASAVSENSESALPEDDTAENAFPEDPEMIEDEASALPTATVKPALFGAAAQSVPTRKPILDEDTLDDVSAAMESMRGDLKSAYTSAMARANDQYSQALSIVSAQIHGTPKPAHEQLLASVTAAYSKAMASASARLDDAIKVASEQLHGTTTKTGILPTTLPIPEVPVEWSQIESIAAERLQQGRAWAEEQYESAKIAIGLATPTPSTPSEHVNKMLDNARHNYYAGVGVAHARYSEFLSAASSALSSMTATPTPTDLAGSASSAASAVSEGASSALSAAADGASSAASVASENVSAAAAAGYDSASSAASVASENMSAAAAAGYDTAAAAGDKVADTWDAVVTKISVQVYGAPTPTPWYSGVYDVVCEQASSAGDSAASVTSAAGAYASAGSDEVARQYAAVSSIVSEALVGKEPSFSDSVISRLSVAYATGLPSAAGQAGEAVRSVGERVASAASGATEAVKEAASDATEAVKDTAASIKDEL
jgi:hypothetical protein